VATASAKLLVDGLTGFLSNNSTTGLFNIPGSIGLNDNITIAATSAAYPALAISATTGQAGFVIDQKDTGGDLFTASAAGTNKFVINKTGAVGIGSSAPAYSLDVVGDGYFSNALRLPYQKSLILGSSGLFGGGGGGNSESID
jgi:hypothetical protein